MAVLIIEPNKDNANPDEWRTLIECLEIFTGEFMCIGLTNMNNSLEPQVMQGSRFEVNGRKFICPANESITGAPAGNLTNYIYAVSIGDRVIFNYSSAEPQWDPAKGGWYSGNNRALAYFASFNGGYNGKTIINNVNGKGGVNMQQPIPDDGGTVIYNKSVKADEAAWLPPGAYRFILKGGDGGYAGAPGSAGTGDPAGVSGQNGAPRGYAATVTGKFYWEGGSVPIIIGGNGYNGGSGGNGGNSSSSGEEYARNGGCGGGAGAGGNGEDSILLHFIARGGRGAGAGTGGKKLINGSYIDPSGGDGGTNAEKGEDGTRTDNTNYSTRSGKGGRGGNQTASNGENGTNGDSNQAKIGGNGGGGGAGAHGSSRPLGDLNAGYCTIYRMW
jgi:hypothetical protein